MEPSTAIYRRFQAEAPGRENRLLFFRMRTQPRVTPLLERMDCPSRPSVDIVLSKCRPRRCGAVVQARTGSTLRLSSKKKKTQIFLSSLLRCCALLLSKAENKSAPSTCGGIAGSIQAHAGELCYHHGSHRNHLGFSQHFNLDMLVALLTQHTDCSLTFLVEQGELYLRVDFYAIQSINKL